MTLDGESLVVAELASAISPSKDGKTYYLA